MFKSLDPVADAQFNDKHPRAQAGMMGLRPGQFAPKSEAEKLRDEAEETEEEDGPPAPAPGSTVVQVGNNAEDAKEAVAKDHADNLRKGVEEAEAVPGPHLIVVFSSRSDATKFAIACDHVQGNSSHLAVTAAANGKYHVEPEGMTAAEIDALQEIVHRGDKLDEITPAAVTANLREHPRAEAAPVDDEGYAPVTMAAADNSAVMSGIEESGREYLQDAVAQGKVTEENIGEVLAIARAISGISDSRENGFLPVSEAIHYGSIEGLRRESEHQDLEMAARARVILEQMGIDTLLKGASMAKPLLLLPITEHPDHDSMENDGKALPVATDESVTDKVGSKEEITEATAKYPRTGHKQARRPRLILKAIAKQADAHQSFPEGYPKEGAEYADPVNKKYPVNTPERAAAAWRYINMPKNAAEYAGGGLQAVKDKIRRACKRHGVNTGA